MWKDDPATQSDLPEYLRNRMKVLVERMFSQWPHLRNDRQIDAYIHNVTNKLAISLRHVRPTNIESFLQLTASEMRLSLEVLARAGLNDDSQIASTGPEFQSTKSIVEGDVTLIDLHDSKPGKGMTWLRFHSAVRQLPAEERTIFDLLYYHGMSRAEVTDLLEIPEPDLNRRWLSSRRMILREMDKPCVQTD